MLVVIAPCGCIIDVRDEKEFSSQADRDAWVATREAEGHYVTWSSHTWKIETCPNGIHDVS